MTILQTTTQPHVTVQVTPPPAHMSVIQGPVSIVGGAQGYRHDQAVPQAVWTINHNLGYNPLVQTFNTGSEEILGGIVHLTPNTTQVSFSGPIAGTARAL